MWIKALRNQTLESAWEPVLQSSIETCLKSGKNILIKFESIITFIIPIKVPTASPNDEKCPYNNYAKNILWCVVQTNFLNCPGAAISNGTSAYDETKKFVETNDKCGQNIGETFIVDGSFWFGDQEAHPTTKESKS